MHRLNRNILLIVLLIFAGSLLKAQPFSRFRENMRESSKVKPTVVFGLDSRITFFSNVTTPIHGVKLGLDFDHRWRVGIGYFRMFSKVNGTYVHDTVTYIGRLRFNYLAGFYEYVPVRKRKWEISLPGYVGAGTAKLEAADSLTRRFVGVSELSVQGHYKIFEWLGLGGGVGYRVLFVPNKRIEERLSNPVISYKIRIWIAPLYRSIVHKENLWDQEWE